MVFKLCVSNCFQMSHRFQWFSNHVFQSVFSNFPIGFNVFSNYVWNCFQSLGFKIMCFKLFSNFPIGFNGFQSMCFKIFQISLEFQWFSKYVFQSVFQISHRFHVFKSCVSKCFQNYVFKFMVSISNNVFQISP